MKRTLANSPQNSSNPSTSTNRGGQQLGGSGGTDKRQGNFEIVISLSVFIGAIAFLRKYPDLLAV
ncbi:7833_t:CDS:2 [Diversispora eburnea]|uniref:7833_t:CDS:1 n=1 Tax=Diversispora eburnea TaxID=1213867 RepID=A0A9N9G4N9_9GLOM|nr:7833_t:CDS:2 [Diversispora eburnea]